MVFADEDSPVYMMGAFDCAVSYIQNQASIEKVFKTGEGLGWGDQPGCLFCGVAKFFRPGYQAHLVQEWLPALAGVVEKLEAAAKVADVGCGHGLSTIVMAEAYPKSHFVGYDFHEGSIEAAKEHAKTHGLQNARFEVSLAKQFDGDGTYDLVCCFDCLHDMGGPAGAATHVRESLKADGTSTIPRHSGTPAVRSALVISSISSSLRDASVERIHSTVMYGANASPRSASGLALSSISCCA